MLRAIRRAPRPCAASAAATVQASLCSPVAAPVAAAMHPARKCFAHASICAVRHFTAATRPLAATASFTASSSAAAASEIIYTQKIARKKSSFRDRVRLHVSGGRGGNGCSSYDTDPYGKGGPDGANGGRGGDVYLVSTDQLSNFAMDSFHLKGQSGHAGGSQMSKGRNGFSLKVPIPAGTVVSEILSTDPTEGAYTLRLLADMDRSGLEIKVANGGAGGLGNRAFTTQYRKQARFSTIGSHGTTRFLLLELKCIADVGLVGYPNAGKSSFLDAVSNARPEIANYPFTTLHPQVGIVEAEDAEPAENSGEDGTAAAANALSASSSSPSPAFSANPSTSMHRLSVADLPGLISGAASANRGLGHEFLKHIQRTKVLCYVVDLSGNDDRDPVEDFLSLQTELRCFDPMLLRRPAIILANKIDNCDRKHSRHWMKTKLADLRSRVDGEMEVFEISCLHRLGLKPAVQRLSKMVRAHAEAERRDRSERMRAELEKEREWRREMEQREQEDHRIEEEEQQQRTTAAATQDRPPSLKGVAAGRLSGKAAP